MSQIPERSPWQQPPLNEWDIVGMNHYFNGKGLSSNGRYLFVAMTKGDKCIRAEGRDEDVWYDLKVKTILVEFPKVFKLSFDPINSTDPHIKTIFEDQAGGLIWCAFRHARLADQHFNEKIAAMMTRLRDQPHWQHANTIAREIPRSILGNSENPQVWAEALYRMIAPLQGMWVYSFDSTGSIKLLDVPAKASEVSPPELVAPRQNKVAERK